MDSARGEPGAKLLGLAIVFVVHHRIEVVHVFAGGEEDLADRFGVFDAFLILGLVEFVGVVEGFVVGAEVFDEISGDFPFDELGAEGGFGGFLRGRVAAIGDGRVVVFEQAKEFFGLGLDARFGEVGGHGVVEDGAAEVRGADAAGGAGDVFVVEPESFQNRGFGGASGDLSGLCVGEVEQVLVDAAKKDFGFAARGEVSGVSVPKVCTRVRRSSRSLSRSFMGGNSLRD